MFTRQHGIDNIQECEMSDMKRGEYRGGSVIRPDYFREIRLN